MQGGTSKPAAASPSGAFWGVPGASIPKSNSKKKPAKTIKSGNYFSQVIKSKKSISAEKTRTKSTRRANYIW